MGIHGLWPLLESTSTSITLDALEGKRLAIDISFWLHQAEQGYNSADLDSKYPHLSLLVHRIAKLLFYKIRPVFVFDGSNVPIFKKQILRDRSLKRHLNELMLNKNQRKKLQQIAKANKSSEDDSLSSSLKLSLSPQKKGTKRSADDDMFQLPNLPTNLNEDDQKNEYDYLEGYDALMSGDARYTFLKEAKERCRASRLRYDEIPQNSKRFSDFQLKRLISRNKINTQLEMLRKDKLHQFVQESSDKTKLIVFDAHFRSHILLRDEEIQILNPEKEEREKFIRNSISWPEFLKREAETKASWQSAESSKKEEPINEADESDDALQEAILASISEQNGLTTACFNNLAESGFKQSSEDYYHDSWTSESENDEDSPENIPCSSISTHNKNLSPKDTNYISSDSSSSLPSSSSSDNDDNNEEETTKSSCEIAETMDNYYLKNSKPNESADSIDEGGVYADCQNLLAIMGLPYLCAPGEAEAQCVELQRLGLVDGIVSDDSDVWLFGAKLVYKNMFSRWRHVQEYRIEKIFDNLGLSQNEFIQIGILSGGDYSRGFEKVGIVAALELIADFLTTRDSIHLTEQNSVEMALKPLEKIGEWLRHKRNGTNEEVDKNFVESKTRIRLRKIIEENNERCVIEKFPNIDVFNAYAHPNVNSSADRFHWNRINFEKFETFLWTKLGWSAEKLKNITHGAFYKWDEFLCQTTQQYQTRITAFMPKDSIVEMNAGLCLPTNRVQIALQRLRSIKAPVNQERFEESDDAEMDAQILADVCGQSTSKLKTKKITKKTKKGRVVNSNLK